MIVHQNRHQKPFHPLSHPWHEVEARREKEASEAEVRLAEFFDNRADTFWKVLARDHLVSVCILPNVNSLELNRDAKQGTGVCSRTTRLKNNQVKSRKRAFKTENDDKGAVASVRIVPQLGCLSQDSESLESVRKPDAKSFGTNSTSTIHTVYATSSKYRGKERTIAWTNTSQNSSSAKSPRSEIWGLISRREWKTTAMRPRQDMESC